MDRNSLFDFARERWGVEPDCPFADYPEAAVLRHTDSGKWFALVMPVKAEKLGLAGRARGEEVDVVNLKLQPPLVTMMLEKEGAFPAYHMNRKHWISVVLGSAFPEGELLELLELSFRLTQKKKKAQRKDES